jgi:hypothetical protein
MDRLKRKRNGRMRRLVRFCLFIGVSSLVIPTVAWAGATTYQWTGATNSNWTTGSNWRPSGPPTSTDNATIPSGAPNFPDITSAILVKDVTIQSGGHLTVSTGGTLTMHNLDNAGTFTMMGEALSVNDLRGAGGAYEVTGGTINISHDFKPTAGTLTATGGTVVFTGSAGNGAFPAALSTTQFFDVQVNSGVDPGFDANAAISFSVAGDWTNNSSAASLALQATTVTFDGTGTQSIGGSQSTTFRNVTVNKSAGTVTVLGNQILTNGDLTISAGTLDLSTYTMNRSSSGGTLTVSNGATLKIGGTNSFPSNYSTHTLGATSTVEYSGTDQRVSNESYGNLTLSGSGTKTMSTSAMTIAGNFTITGTASATAEADMTIGGDFTIDAGATFDAASYTIQVNGNFTSNGTFDAGTSTLTITGPNSTMDADTLNNLTVSNSNGLALGRDQVVKHSLSLAGGKLKLGPHTLTIESTASITGLSPSNYVVLDGSGSLKRKGVGSSSIAFPVGTTSSYNPVTISNSGSQADFSIHIDNSFDHPLPDPNRAVNTQWKITKTGGVGSIATVTLQWTAADEAAGFNRTGSIYVGHFNGTQWEQFPATFTDLGNGEYSATATGFTSFSPFGVGNDGALPIQMAGSAANVLRDNDVEVTWKTISETNNFGFEIFRKRGSEKEWTKIGFVSGHGTTLAPQSYSFVDHSVPFGEYSYQIKQIDLDGTSETFPAMNVTVGVSPEKAVLGQNFPNPFNPSTTINFVIPMTGHVEVRVYNVLGQEVATLFNGTAQGGKIHTAVFNASNLSSGLYFYTLTGGGKTETKRMLLMK